MKYYITILILLSLSFIACVTVPIDNNTAIQSGLDELFSGTIQNDEYKIAVLPLVDFRTNEQDELGSYLSNDVIYQISRYDSGRIRMLERDLINSIMTELEFSMTGMISGEEVKEFGRMSGANFLIVGTKIVLEDQIQMNLRLVDVESAEILGVTQVNLDLDSKYLSFLEGSPQVTIESNNSNQFNNQKSAQTSELPSNQLTFIQNDPRSKQVINDIQLRPIGKYFYLNGTSDYAEIPFSKSLAITKTLTLEALVRVDSFPSSFLMGYVPGSYNVIINQTHSGSWAGNYTLGVYQSGAFFMFEPTDSHYIVSFDLEVGRWYHLAVTHTFGDGLNTKFYINGQPLDGYWVDDRGDKIDGNYKINPIQSNNPYWIGKIGNGESENYFHGGIDELRIWNKIVPQKDIEKNMQNSLSGKESGLVANFNFQ